MEVSFINTIDDCKFIRKKYNSGHDFVKDVIFDYYSIKDRMNYNEFKLDENVYNNSIVFSTINENIRISENDAGIDVSNLEDILPEDSFQSFRSFLLRPFLVKTGTKIKLPIGLSCMVLPRSSSPLKYGYTIANSPGLIDYTYRGDIGLIINVFNYEKFSKLCKYKDNDVEYVPKGTRLAQLVIIPAVHSCSYYYQRIFFIVTNNKHIYNDFDKLFPSKRGSCGFGSTGI